MSQGVKVQVLFWAPFFSKFLRFLLSLFGPSSTKDYIFSVPFCTLHNVKQLISIQKNWLSNCSSKIEPIIIKENGIRVNLTILLLLSMGLFCGTATAKQELDSKSISNVSKFFKLENINNDDENRRTRARERNRDRHRNGNRDRDHHRDRDTGRGSYDSPYYFDSQCEGYCYAGTCMNGYAGDSCSFDSQCNGYCYNGSCQDGYRGDTCSFDSQCHNSCVGGTCN